MCALIGRLLGYRIEPSALAEPQIAGDAGPVGWGKLTASVSVIYSVVIA